MDLQSITLILITILLFILSVSIFAKQQRSFASGVFALSVLLAGIWSLTSVVNHLSDSVEVVTLFTRLSYLTALVTILLLLIFSELFLEKHKLHKIRIATYIALTAILSIFIVFTSTIVEKATIRTSDVNESAQFGNLFFIYAILVLGFLGAMFSNFFKSLRETVGVYRNQIKYILIGTVFSIAAALLVAVIFPLIGVNNLGYLAPFASTIAMLFIYYSIFRYRFLDIRLFVSYALEMLFLIVCAYTFFYGIVFVDELLFGSVYAQNAIIAGLGFSILFIFSMKAISTWVRNKFIIPNFSYEGLSIELNKIIGTTLDRFEISKLFAEYISNKLGVEYIFIVYSLKSEVQNEKYEVLYDASNQENKGKKITSLTVEDISSLIKDELKPIITEEVSTMKENSNGSFFKEIYARLKKQNIEVTVPITLDNKSISGYIFIGNKKSGDGFSAQEIKIIENLVRPFTFALQRAVLYAETEQFANTLQVKVEDATKELRKKYEEERDMVGIIGHELRTPLTIAKNMLDLLISKIKKMRADGKVDFAYIEEKTDAIQDALLREANIVETALSTSRVDNDKVEITNEKVNLLETIEFVIKAHESQAKLKGIAIKYEEPENVPLFISDSSKVQEIITNLVSNAIKYTRQGFIEISLKNDDKYMYISVRDTGDGIPQELIPKLGQKFYRLNQYLDDKKSVVRAGGTGLGLYVVKGYLKLMGGELTVESELSKGSVFTAKIPLNNDKTDYKEAQKVLEDEADMFAQIGLENK